MGAGIPSDVRPFYLIPLLANDNSVWHHQQGVAQPLPCTHTKPPFNIPIKQFGHCAMTKSDLIARLAELNPHLSRQDVERIVTTIFDEIGDALAQGNRVELRGFGAFSVKRRDARVGRNPRTGEAVHVAEKLVPFFKTGKQLRERLNAD